MPKERLQKIIARAGLASRREAESWIREGLVTVNGKVVGLGDQADLREDAIKVKGKLLQNKEPLVYYLFHKPKGIICSVGVDSERRKTLKDFLNRIPFRVFPVGRLDFNGEGLLLLTNDGDFAYKMQKSANIVRTYRIKVKGYPDTEALQRLKQGAVIDGTRIVPHSVRVAEKLQSKVFLEVSLIGPGSMDVRALMKKKGFLVERVLRVALGQLKLGDLPPGGLRILKASQIEALLKQPELGVRNASAAAAKSIKPTRPSRPAASK